jgi:sulfur carrier protein ThiS
MPIKIFLRKKEYQIDHIKDLTVAKALSQLNLIPEAHLVIRRGQMITEQELLRDGDEIKIISVISGGNL